MKVILAGFNIDRETLKAYRNQLERLSVDHRVPDELRSEITALVELDNLTPETLSAAYARISRNPAPIPELREISRNEIDKARKSNRNIIFGLGHSSVAEHAVFNLDIMGVSRLAVEEIEKFRLCSFTEKSQRYILLEDDFVVPAELNSKDLQKKFRNTIASQNKMYHGLYERIRPYFFEKYSILAADKKNHRRLEGLAKEDARYVIAQATEAQLGMTVNARNLEHIIKRCAAHPLHELNEFANQLHDQLHNLVPSLVKYTEPTEYDLLTHNALKSVIGPYKTPKISGESVSDVSLVHWPENGDDQILQMLMYSSGQMDFNSIKDRIAKMNYEQKKQIFLESFRFLQSYDSVLREFEMADLVFELSISCSCYAQLKRHRLASIFVKPYDTSLGTTLPESIEAVKATEPFMEIMRQTEEVYTELYKFNPLIAPYILTNAHRRKVIFKSNARALYHFSRLREDEHAQWDIRNIAREMVNQVRQKMPLTFMLACGKDNFESTKTALFSTKND